MATKPYTLIGEPTARTVEEIDKMLHELYQVLAEQAHPLLSALHSDTETADVERGALIVGQGEPTLEKWTLLPLGDSARVLRSDGQDASWAQVVLTTDVTGTLPATNGGTGHAVYAVGDLLYASTTTALSRLADVATGNALISGGVNTAPAWGKIGLTTHVSGTLAVANGGTGRDTHTAYAVICGGTTASGAQQSVSGVGTTGQVLTSNGAAALPTWQDATGGETHEDGYWSVLTNGDPDSPEIVFADGDVVMVWVPTP